MSRPRKPFGSSQPGRLPSTMMKVLAAEMSDPQRLRRGKQYAHDGAVLDILVDEGVVTCEVQGSRPTPYVVSLEVTRGDGMPLRRDVQVSCTCPDDDNWNDLACKHAIAAMFTFATELLIEPELLDVWRGREAHASGATDATESADHGADELDDRTDRSEPGDGPWPDRGSLRRRDRRHLRVVRDDHDADPDEVGDATGDDTDHDHDTGHDQDGGSAGDVDVYALAAAVPDGAAIPDIPRLERVEFPVPRQRELAAILRDAADAMRLDWD